MKRTALCLATDEVEQHGMIDDLRGRDQIRIEFKAVDRLDPQLKQELGLLYELCIQDRGIRHTFDAGQENLAVILNPQHQGGFHGYTVYQFTMGVIPGHAAAVLHGLVGLGAIKRLELLDPADLATT